MMLAVTVLCIWLGITCNRANRQRRAVEVLAQTGTSLSVEYDYQCDDKGITLGGTHPSPPGPEWLRNLIGVDYFATVVSVELARSHTITDDSFRLVAELPHLKFLGCGGARLTGRGLVSLYNNGELDQLALQVCTVSDDGWAVIGKMKQIKKLDLASSTVSDSALEQIGTLSELEYLRLDGTQITDEGLKHLCGLHHLKNLIVDETAVTKTGVQKLQQRLPQLEISGP